MRWTILLVGLLALLPRFCCARTWRVPSECPTIPAGLDSAAYGDTVLVGPGSYTVTYGSQIYVPAGRVLMSEAGPEATLIEICDISTGIHVYQKEAVRVSGFGIRYDPDCEPPMGWTYGVHCFDCTDVIVEDCIIEDVSYGICFEGTSQEWWRPLFRDNIIENCTRGVACLYVYDPGRPFFKDNTITDCYYGADIEDSSPLFEGNHITYCDNGMYYMGHCGGNCDRNVIAHNEECGVYVWCDPPLAAPWFNGGLEKAEANDIYDNGTWDIWYLHTGDDALIGARYNYWGGGCPDFGAKIHGRVVYSPWVNSTHTVSLNEEDCPGAVEASTWGSIKATFR
jgi:hypothetical protein